MYTNGFTSIKILYILFYILNVFLCERLRIIDLKSIVSKKDSKGWLDSLNLTNNTNPYCHLCCIKIKSETIGKECGSHTLCKYPMNKTGPDCKGYIFIGFSRVEKEALLDAHNTLRNIVASGLESRGNSGPQPSAANMRALQWNDELALIAERWAAQCIYSHDVCRDLERFPVGQNIARGNLATNNELSFIKTWYDEVQHFNAVEVGNFKLPKNDEHISGRYTQLVWADTYQLGCARASFQQSKGLHVTYREHFICNYGPTGNIPNQPVYVPGTPCTACHEGTSCMLDYPALCEDEVSTAGEEHDVELRSVNIKMPIPKIRTIESGHENCKFISSHFLVLFLCIFYEVLEYIMY